VDAPPSVLSKGRASDWGLLAPGSQVRPDSYLRIFHYPSKPILGKSMNKSHRDGSGRGSLDRPDNPCVLVTGC
jgi:hypothetical protein